MKYKILIAFFAIFLLAGAVFAGEEAAEGEKKPKAPDKPRPDSAVSSVLQLPVVKEWQRWMESRKGVHLTAWGEAVKEVDGHTCWDVAVGEESGGEVHIWRRFCIMKAGIEILVESLPTDPLDEIHYFTYDDWLLKCQPSFNSPGKC